MTKSELYALIGANIRGQGGSVDCSGKLPTILEGIIDIVPEGSMTEISYANLKTLRDAEQLKPGTFYRITDYVTTVKAGYTVLAPDGETTIAVTSAGHAFDVIVLAITTGKFSEDAWAALHSGDTYFANCNLSLWRLKYHFDNTDTKFYWADATNGKGVIYCMTDEYGNTMWQDFKNILFDGHYSHEYNGADRTVTSNKTRMFRMGPTVSGQSDRYDITLCQLSAYSNTYGAVNVNLGKNSKIYTGTWKHKAFSNIEGGRNCEITATEALKTSGELQRVTMGDYASIALVSPVLQDIMMGNHSYLAIGGSRATYITVGNNASAQGINSSSNAIQLQNVRFDEYVWSLPSVKLFNVRFVTKIPENTDMSALTAGTSVETDKERFVGIDTSGALNVWNPADSQTPALMTETTYAALKTLRDAGNLVPGMFYRITDYAATIKADYSVTGLSSSGTITWYPSVANHPFDIIVLALSGGKLSENASAIAHAGDTYYSNCDLSKWKLKYTIDNNDEIYNWADSVNGKGVVFRLTDDRGNSLPCDFKNILIDGYYPFFYSSGNDVTVGASRYVSNIIVEDAFSAGTGGGRWDLPVISINGTGAKDIHLGRGAKFVCLTSGYPSDIILGDDCQWYGLVSELYMEGSSKGRVTNGDLSQIKIGSGNNVEFAGNFEGVEIAPRKRDNTLVHVTSPACYNAKFLALYSDVTVNAGDTSETHMTFIAPNTQGTVKVWNPADLVQ